MIHCLRKGKKKHKSDFLKNLFFSSFIFDTIFKEFHHILQRTPSACFCSLRKFNFSVCTDGTCVCVNVCVYGCVNFTNHLKRIPFKKVKLERKKKRVVLKGNFFIISEKVKAQEVSVKRCRDKFCQFRVFNGFKTILYLCCYIFDTMLLREFRLYCL